MLTRLRKIGLLRIATVYVVAGWIVIQFADIGLDAFGAPAMAMQAVMGLVFIGFPVAMGALWLTGVRLNKAEQAHTLETAEPEMKDSRPSLLLLPFKQLGEDGSFTAEGLRMGLQTNMVRLSGLFQVFAFDSGGYHEGEISGVEKARMMGAAHILEGSAQAHGERVRVTLQLTETATGATTWAQQYDRDLVDLFELQDDIIRGVVAALHIVLRASDLGEDWFRQLTTPEAKEYYLRGQNALSQQSPAGMAEAREYFTALYQLEPNASIGPSNIVLTYWHDYSTGWTGDPAHALEEAYRWSDIARALEPNDGLADTVYAHKQLHARNFDEALTAAQSSSQMRPSCPISLAVLALVENYLGDSEAAIRHGAAALERMDIAAPTAVNILAAAQRDHGDYEASIQSSELARALNPANVEALIIECQDHIRKGDLERAKSVAEQVREFDSNWSSEGYASNNPYRDQAVLAQQLEELSEVGLG